MNIDLDCRGMACPKPLMMTKKELEAGRSDIRVCVDNETAVKNLTRLAQKSHLNLEVENQGTDWILHFMPQSGAEQNDAQEGKQPAEMPTGQACGTFGCGYSVFIGKDHIGDGAQELGYNLMKMALYTLSESDDVPASILFMNSGVTLVAGDKEEHQQIVENLQTLMDKGTEILVCGTCLNYYGLDDQLLIGDVSNMYDILERMKEAAKVITL